MFEAYPTMLIGQIFQLENIMYLRFEWTASVMYWAE